MLTKKMIKDKERNHIKVAAMIAEECVEHGDLARLSAKLKVPEATLCNLKILLRLPEPLQVALTDKKITFKCARALSRIMVNEDKLLAIAEPVVDGTIGSNTIEIYTSLIKNNPAMTIETAVRLAKERRGAEDLVIAEPVKPQLPPQSTVRPSSMEIFSEVVKLRAMLMIWKRDGSTETLRADSALKSLQREIKNAQLLAV